jgi:adenylate cyclase, class 2
LRFRQKPLAIASQNQGSQVSLGEDRKRSRDVCPDGEAPGQNDVNTFAILAEVERGSRTGTKATVQNKGIGVARETEIKLRIEDLRGFQRLLKKLGARPVGNGSGRVHEENVIFDTPQGGLAKHGQLLRIRTESPESRGTSTKSRPKPRVVLTFKRPVARPTGSDSEHPADSSHKVREEIEMEVTDGATLTTIFEGLGMSGWFRYEKFRTTFRLPASKAWARGLLIELDETPIGTFVELEGPALAIDRAASELGYSKRDYVLKNYLTLYVEDCRRRGEQPVHMLFPAKVSPAR